MSGDNVTDAAKSESTQYSSSYDDELCFYRLIINNQMADEEKQKLLAMSRAGMFSDETVSRDQGKS
ncbi:MAG: hypothetical protein ACLU8S_03140 [Coprococcus phoceensis]